MRTDGEFDRDFSSGVRGMRDLQYGFVVSRIRDGAKGEREGRRRFEHLGVLGIARRRPCGRRRSFANPQNFFGPEEARDILATVHPAKLRRRSDSSTGCACDSS